MQGCDQVAAAIKQPTQELKLCLPGVLCHLRGKIEGYEEGKCTVEGADKGIEE